MPAPPLPWDDATAAFDGELRAWDAYAARIRLWTDALDIRLGAGHAPSEEHRRVIGEVAPQAMREQAEWVASGAERTARLLREHLAAGEIAAALLLALRPEPSARGFDYRAPGFWRGPLEPGDLPPTWSVSDRARCDLLRRALLPEAPPAWFLRTLQPWARPLSRLLWTDAYSLDTIPGLYAAHLENTGNPWASPNAA